MKLWVGLMIYKILWNSILPGFNSHNFLRENGKNLNKKLRKWRGWNSLKILDLINLNVWTDFYGVHI